MTLAAGAALGPYDVVGPLGKGGMGEVYRARDTRLHRDVAIKILPALFADDAERIARFEREAQLLAALNHPHIAAIHGLEEAAGSRFLVLELVDGESLASRLARGRLPIDEALAVARQIVDALEAAHDKGIIHRDLKPANVMLTADGQVKVLDFGLAKDVGAATSSAAMNSPTLTLGATQAGVILGTAAYMSPEQAKGRAADKRSDVWAFGCVLYEMLTGLRAFQGDDVSETLASVIKGEPDWQALPADVPPHVRAVVRRCLEKDRRARIPEIAVARFLLAEPDAADSAPVAVPRITRTSSLAWKIAAALFALAAGAAAATSYLTRTPPSVVRFLVEAPDGATFVTGGIIASSAVISPDGTKLAFTARNADGRIQLWVRGLDALTAQPLPGTDEATFPFWSPDSRFIAFFSLNRLQKVAVSGGPPQTLCTAQGRGGTWNRDGVIVINSGPGALLRVSAAGGEPVRLTHAPGQFPSFLPHGRHLLYYNAGTSKGPGLFVAPLENGEAKWLTAANSGAVYAGGRLLFVRAGTLLAQPFDLSRLELTGEPVPLAERVEHGARPGLVAFSASDTGALAYGVGTGTAGGLKLSWVDRQGKVTGSVGPEGGYYGVALAPDGTRAAAHRHDESGGDIWVTDLSRNVTSRFTFDISQDNSAPIWSPDGRWIVFASRRGGRWGLYRKPANGAGDEERLLDADVQIVPSSFAPDAQTIVYEAFDVQAREDVWMLRLDAAARKPVPLLNTPFRESHGVVSPDGRWLAYQSNETGRTEVYVRPFPSGPGKWQISSNAGMRPEWSASGRELFFLEVGRGAAGHFHAVEVTSQGATFATGPPKALFVHGIDLTTTTWHSSFHAYAVAPDDRRFLLQRIGGSPSASATRFPIAVVLNWTAALEN